MEIGCLLLKAVLSLSQELLGKRQESLGEILWPGSCGGSDWMVRMALKCWPSRVLLVQVLCVALVLFHWVSISAVTNHSHILKGAGG